MGLFMDLWLQSQVVDQERRSVNTDLRARSLEIRVDELEDDLLATRRLLRDVVKRLEEVVGEDINRDGKVGREPG
jgi:hypothetical protein